MNLNKEQKQERRQNLTTSDRIILEPIAFLICEFHFVYLDMRTYLEDIPPGMTKRIWIAILIIPIFFTFLAISQFPRIEKRLRPRFRIIY